MPHDFCVSLAFLREEGGEGSSAPTAAVINVAIDSVKRLYRLWFGGGAVVFVLVGCEVDGASCPTSCLKQLL